MDWGVHLPHLGRRIDIDGLVTYSQEVDRLGFHSVWASDHVVLPTAVASHYPYTEDGSFPGSGMGWLDPLGTLQFVAGITEHVRLGFTVLILPYRQPVVTAKQLATIDLTSKGRLILGVGVGWMREEAEALGMPWDRRGARSDEQLEVFERLFRTEGPVAFDGEFYSFDELEFEPKPVQQPIPVWVGGHSAAAFRRVARHGHGFHAAFQKLDTVVEEWSRVRDECIAIGRDPDEIELSLRLYLDTTGAMEPEKSIAGSTDQMLDTIGRCAEAGITHLLLDPVARGGVPARLDALRAFMTEVAPQV